MKIRQGSLMFGLFVVWWCLCVLGRIDFSPSSDEQMPATDTTQNMGILVFYVNVTTAFMRQSYYVNEAAAFMRQPLQSSSSSEEITPMRETAAIL